MKLLPRTMPVRTIFHSDTFKVTREQFYKNGSLGHQYWDGYQLYDSK